MVLKNWKRITNLSYVKRYENVLTKENLIVRQDSLNDWLVSSWKLSMRRFKTFKNAEKFAKSYMGSH